MVSEDDLENILDERGPFTVVDYNRDRDIEGAIVGQRELIINGIENLTEEQQGEINEITNAVLVKIGALRHHAKAFRTYQESRYQEIAQDESKVRLIQKGLTVCERELTYEFDAYMYQFKSSLDMLVKILGYIFEGNPKVPQTYGNSGEGVIDYLGKKKRHFQRQGRLAPLIEYRIDRIIELIRGARAPWLKPLIDWRDTISHYNPILTIGFGWNAEENALQRPLAIISEEPRPLLQVIEGQVQTLIKYSAEFIARSISYRFPDNVELSPLKEAEKERFGDELKMDLTYARYKAVKCKITVSVKGQACEVLPADPEQGA